VTDLKRYRIYGLDEMDAKTRYPFEWETIKHEVRADAGHRCLRCQHPYVVGESGVWEVVANTNDVNPAGERFPQSIHLFDGIRDEVRARRPKGKSSVNWSPCDGNCRHVGPMRVWCSLPNGTEGWEPFWPEKPEGCGPAVEAVGKAEAAWRILTVHHLNGDKADLRWWNLVALCQRCHLEIQGKVNMDQVWPLEHTPWFRPYAAGYYAAVYLGEDLMREEVEDRLDELLLLERADA